MKNNITERQQAIYDFIRATLAARGIPPTMREIGERFAIRSTNGVNGHLAALERIGLIARERGRSRGIALPSARRTASAVPLLGRVAAGRPVLSPENREGDLTIDLSLFALRTAENLYALKVKGESMLDAHILDGDTVLVRQQTAAEGGDIVVALVEGEATVKRFFQEGGRVRLQPENTAMQPLILEHGDVRILGRVVGVLRRI